jgi:hypothetical protein
MSAQANASMHEAERAMRNLGWGLLAGLSSAVGVFAGATAGWTLGGPVDAFFGSPLGKGGGGWILPDIGYGQYAGALLGALVGAVVGAALPRVIRRRQSRLGLALVAVLLSTLVSVPACLALEVGWLALAVVPLITGVVVELDD